MYKQTELCIYCTLNVCANIPKALTYLVVIPLEQFYRIIYSNISILRSFFISHVFFLFFFSTKLDNKMNRQETLFAAGWVPPFVKNSCRFVRLHTVHLLLAKVHWPVDAFETRLFSNWLFWWLFFWWNRLLPTGMKTTSSKKVPKVKPRLLSRGNYAFL